jgi:serine/threonine protein kinase
MMLSVEEVQKALPSEVEVVELVAQGGQRHVFRALCSGTQTALKVMPVRNGGLERAEREAAMGYTLRHPNLVRIHDEVPHCISINGRQYCYFCEDFIEGQLLKGQLGDWTPCEVLSLAYDLASAVTYLWDSHTVVHRDINPKNIIRATDGRYVLLDIGYGRHQTKPGLTQSIVLRGPGTTGYLSPEQLAPSRKLELDFRSDLFLIGIVCYEALLGRKPFVPGAGYETALLGGTYERVTEPVVMAKIIEKLLRRQPYHRYARSSQLFHDIGLARKELRCS